MDNIGFIHALLFDELEFFKASQTDSDKEIISLLQNGFRACKKYIL